MAQQNMKVEQKGKMLLISINTDVVVSKSGTPLKFRGPQKPLKEGEEAPEPKMRVNDLIATSGGFMPIEGGFTVSLNVNRDPAIRLAAVKT